MQPREHLYQRCDFSRVWKGTSNSYFRYFPVRHFVVQTSTADMCTSHHRPGAGQLSYWPIRLCATGKMAPLYCINCCTETVTLRSAKQPIMLSADLGYYLSGIKVISWFLRDFQSKVSPTCNISVLCYIIFIIEWLLSDLEMLWHSGPDQQTFTGSVVQ